MRANRETWWLHWFVSGKPHASAIMFKAAPSKNPLLIRLLFPGVREPAAFPRVTRSRPGLWSAIFLAFRSVPGGFRAPITARHFSNFRLAVAEIGSIADRDRFAGHPSGIRRIPARESQFTANAALQGENRFLSCGGLLALAHFLAHAFWRRKSLNQPAQMRKIDHAAHAFVLPISIDLREEFVFGFRQIEHVARKWLILLVPQSHLCRQHIRHGVTKGTAAKTVTQEKRAAKPQIKPVYLLLTKPNQIMLPRQLYLW